MSLTNEELLELYLRTQEKETKTALQDFLKNEWDKATAFFSIDPIIRALILLLSQVFYDEFHYPQPQVGRYDIVNNNFEKLKWVYRHWFNQLEVAEKGSGIEAYMRTQDLSFSPPEGFQETTRVSVTNGGDILAVDVLTEENTTHLFDSVADFYFSGDIRCANLESTIYADAPFGRNQVAGQAAKMNTSEGVFQHCYLDGNGINLYTTANNHSFDYDVEGLLATLDVLDKYGVYHAGTNRTQEAQEDVLIVDKNGIKIAILSYTMDLNGHIPDETHAFMVNEVRFNDETCDIEMVEKHVARAKEKGADIILAYCHWGWEFEMYPHANVMEAGHRMLELGIDAILGNHPHVAQPMERYVYEKDGEEKAGLIIYACGDFVAYHPKSKNSKISYITKFDIVKGLVEGKETTVITDLKMMPVYMLNEQIQGDVYDCRMLKFSDVMADNGENGKYVYNIPAEDRAQLPHLDDVVLRQILLPENYQNILVD